MYDKIEGRLRDRQMKESALLELIKASDPSPTMYQEAVSCEIGVYGCAWCSVFLRTELGGNVSNEL